jgi:hypothetical protein
MAFATGMQARLPLGPLARGFLTTPQASLDAADWPVAPRPASTPGSRPTPGAALPGTLASPRAGLPPAGCRELVARLRRGAPPFGGPRRPSYWTHIPEESPRLIAAAAYLSSESATISHALTRLTAQSARSEPHSQPVPRSYQTEGSRCGRRRDAPVRSAVSPPRCPGRASSATCRRPDRVPPSPFQGH